MLQANTFRLPARLLNESIERIRGGLRDYLEDHKIIFRHNHKLSTRFEMQLLSDRYWYDDPPIR